VGHAGAFVFASRNSSILALDNPEIFDAPETLNNDTETPGPFNEVSNIPQKVLTGLIDHVNSRVRG